MSERDTKYTIAECAELPSKGLIYDKQVNPNVELRSMTARDEMKRLAPSKDKFRVLSEIIEGCMIEKPAIHVYDMSLGDYQYLLHKLRIVTYGPDYKMIVECPKCGHVFEGITNLDDLEILEFDYDKFKEYQIFDLPVSGDTIKLRFETPRMLDEIDAKVKDLKRKAKNPDIDFNIFTTLIYTIESVNDEELDPVKMENYINRLPAKDMQKILKNLDLLNESVGLKQLVYLDCPECGQEIQTFFRFGSEFFGPTTI